MDCTWYSKHFIYFAYYLSGTKAVTWNSFKKKKIKWNRNQWKHYSRPGPTIRYSTSAFTQLFITRIVLKSRKSSSISTIFNSIRGPWAETRQCAISKYHQNNSKILKRIYLMSPWVFLMRPCITRGLEYKNREKREINHKNKRSAGHVLRRLKTLKKIVFFPSLLTLLQYYEVYVKQIPRQDTCEYWHNVKNI